MSADLVALPTNALILFLVGTALPPLTALLTKWHAPDYLKKLVTTVLAVAAAAVAEGAVALQAGKDWTFYGLLTSAIITWLSANFSYSKFWQDSPLVDAITKATAGFGLSATPKPWPFPEPKPTDVGQPAIQEIGTTVAVGEAPVVVESASPAVNVSSTRAERASSQAVKDLTDAVDTVTEVAQPAKQPVKDPNSGPPKSIYDKK